MVAPRRDALDRRHHFRVTFTTPRGVKLHREFRPWGRDARDAWHRLAWYVAYLRKHTPEISA